MRYLSIVLLSIASGVFGADIDADQQSDEAAIRMAVEKYVTAYNRGDSQAVAAMWLPDAVYVIRETGEQIVGRDAIEKQFDAVFKATEKVELEATTHSVQFVSPNVALEFGVAKVTEADQAPEESEYTAVYVKREGEWLLDRVTEEEVPVVLSNYEHLKDLEWMIGNWIDRDDQATVETTCQWTKNRNFITRMFSVTVRDRIDMSGMQIVGWDPAAKQIRSWVFDSDGGFGEGRWSKKDRAWHIQVSGTAPDGSHSSSTQVMTLVDDNTFTWQSIDRVAGGELLPNVDEFVVVRQTPSE